MKLPDFSRHVRFNQLRQQMGAELISWHGVGHWESINIIEILKTTGIDVSSEEIEYAPDGTLEYKGQKVVIYIRDQIVSMNSYRFHVADCSTLQKMRSAGRYERYVVATRTDGKFIVNFYQGRILLEEEVECELHVCKNCLTRLNYKLYRRSGKSERDKIWESFTLEEFFETYDSQITRKPTHTDITAPQNTYSSDWNQVSLRYREKVSWTCEECRLYLGKIKRFLQVHHINAQKNDNREQNFRALCIGCHAKMPQHHQLKYIPEYDKFVRWRNQQKLQSIWQS